LGSIISMAEANGSGGPVGITAGSLLIDGSAAQSAPTGIISDTFGSGKAGDVSVTAGTLTIRSNGALASVTTGSGNTGSVSVKVTDTVMVDALNANPNFSIVTGIASSTLGTSTGNAGPIRVDAGSLSIGNGGRIVSSTSSGTSGGTGDLIINAESL